MYSPPGELVAFPREVDDPQHSTRPLRRSPQACSMPALTAANTPSGESLSTRLFPQHSTEPPGRSPQAASRPADTPMNSPLGASAAWGEESQSRFRISFSRSKSQVRFIEFQVRLRPGLEPVPQRQHSTPPSPRSPQV